MNIKVVVLLTLLWLWGLSLSVGQDSIELTDSLEPISPMNASRLEALVAHSEEGLSVERAMFSPDSRLLAYTTDQSLTLWETETQSSRWELSVSPNYYDFNPMLPLLSINLSIWNYEAGNQLTVLFPPEEFAPWTFQLGDVEFSLNGDQLLAAYINNGAGLLRWSVDNGTLEVTMEQTKARVSVEVKPQTTPPVEIYGWKEQIPPSGR
jgi:WD40 repeat protein